MKYIEFKGNLTTHYETGMEYLGLGVYLDHPKFRTINRSYNPQDSNYGPEYFWTYEGLILLKKNDKLEIELIDGSIQTFMIGNRTLAKEHGYKLGEAYPQELNLSELHLWAAQFNSNLKAKIIRPIKKVAFYGGTFDPMHLGHKKIIEHLHYSFDEVIVLPTNNYNKKDFIFTLDERIHACQAVANNYNNVKVIDWSLHMETSKTYEMFLKLKELYAVEPVIVIGSDNISSIEKWVNYEELKKCPFLIFQRGTEKVTPPLENYQIINNAAPSVSSTDIKASYQIDNIPAECHSSYNLIKMKKD